MAAQTTKIKNVEFLVHLTFKGGNGMGRGNHLIIRRTEGVIIRNWEPKREIIEEELNSDRLLKSVGQLPVSEHPILLGGKSVCSLNLF